MNKCIDCKKEISRYAKRCRSCANKGENHPNWQNKKPVCVLCGKELTTYGKKRCQSCAAKERYKDSTNNPNYKDGRSIKVNYCQDCGKEIDWKAIYCKSCFQKGKRSWRFVDGRSHIDYPEGWTNSLKRKIMERDNFICQICGKYSIKLCVHHKDTNKQNCSEDNLITLCRKCHGQIHYLILSKKVI